MESYIVFENAVYQKRLEYKFYRFCLRRQLSLLRYVPLYFLISFLYFFHLVSRKKYLEVRWSFLSVLKEPEAKVEAFFAAKEKRMLLPKAQMTILTEHPSQILDGLCKTREYNLCANDYDVASHRFLKFRKIKDMLPVGQDYIAYGTLCSPILKGATKSVYVYKRHTMESKRKYVAVVTIHYLLTYAAMLVYALALGVASLHFAAAAFSEPELLFHSYFQNRWILLLNFAPPVILILFLYFLFNNAAAAAALTSALVIVPTWINHFKLLFRNDPFLLEDVTLISEAKAMAGRYQIVLSNGMFLMIGLMVVAVVFFAIFLNCGTRHSQIRLLMVVLLGVGMVEGFNQFYISSLYYQKTANPDVINIWISTQQFQSRGFIYPFLNSSKSAIDHPPQNYSEAEAKAELAQFTYADIPEDKKVNVISIMLEAYGDFTRFDQLQFVDNPYAYFYELREESYSGVLLNNIFAAGTINTERGFITGLTQLPSFRRQTNTYVWYFAEQGYTVEGSHPCNSWFYNRKNINENLGFQNYYFDEDTYKALNDGRKCANDDILFPNIVKLFEEATDRGEKYFSFNVTYQGHGPYSDVPAYSHPYIENLGYSESDFNTLNNYFSIIEDIDLALKDMVDSLRASDEPVVLILFGDHMPWMGNNNSIYKALGINFDLSTQEGFHNYYETPYVIWANDAAKEMLECDFQGEGPTIGSYYLMNEFFHLAGYQGNEYMQYASMVSETLPVIHTSGAYGVDGEVVRTLDEAQQELLRKFEAVQYYWRRNFIAHEES